jgi:hypothetical protein
MRKTLLLLSAFGLMIGLSACGTAQDQMNRIKTDAEIIKVCKDNGGNPWVNLFGAVQCDMGEATDD